MQLSKQRISIVVPCYNAERFLRGSLASALAQDYSNKEIILVDDGSTDASIPLVEREFPQVRIVRQQNGGVASARNRGISESTGEWIAFLDADDIWLPGKLSAQIQAIEKHGTARMCYTAWSEWVSLGEHPESQLINELKEQSHLPSRWSGPSGWIYPELLEDCHVWTTAVIIHRNIFDEIGGFDTSLRIGEDWDLWLRASRITPIIKVPMPYALYRIQPTSLTRGAPDTNHPALVITRALEKWGLFSADGRKANYPNIRRRLSLSWTDHAAGRLDVNDLPGAIKAAWLAVKMTPLSHRAWAFFFRMIFRIARIKLWNASGINT